MKKPRLKAHLVPVRTADDKIFLLTETGSHLLSGRTERAVLPLLDGTRGVADIALELSADHPLPAVVTAIGKYAAIGVLAEGSPNLSAAETAFWDAVAGDAAAAAERTRSARVGVRTVGEAPAEGLIDALRRSGIPVVAGAEPADLTVVVADDYLHPDLAELNRDFHAQGRRWMLVKPRGYWPFYGPVFTPESGPCWECLRQRLDSNRMVEQYLRQFGGLEEPAVLGRSATAGSAGAVESLAAVAIGKLLAGAPADEVTDRIVSLDTRKAEMAGHPVVRLPQCPVCGDPKVMAADPAVVLEGAPVTFSSDGGFRTMPPEATFDRLKKHISPVSGAVSWLEPLSTDDSGMSYSYSAGHNFAMVRNNITILRKNLRGNSGGKGRTDIQAKVSGICEAIERFSGVWSDDRPTLRARAADLPGRHLLPNDLMLFGPEQFAHRRTINADPTNLLHRVPVPFDPELTIDWTAAWSLTSDEIVHVPSAYVWFGHPDCSDHFFTYSDGNGNAAGNTLEEAVLQGFFELVERDAVGIWWYNRLSRRGVDLASFADPYIDALTDYYASMGRSLWMLDLTTDLGIPTFAALSRRVDHPVEDIILAFGSHADPRLAALRALTEVNQFLPAVHGRDAQGETRYLEEDAATLDWWRNAKLADHPYLSPATDRPAAGITDFELPALPTVADYVRLCVERARAAGHEVLVVDQSRPDLELRVAKVMSPGLRHFWRRLGPGRLYDLPVRTGELAAPRDFAELNPISVFF